MFKCAQEDGFGFSLMQGPEILDLDSIPFPERAMSLAFDILNDLVKVRPSAVLHDICLPVMLLPNNMCALVGSANQYKGIGDCVQTIVREEGPPALLKGKHGIEKQPFQLPDFIAATGTKKIRQKCSFIG
ncbi:uncharacterized protein LOC133738160 isoform X6 [Rosa rugosa]|uniref:uncharacterized protein LOC133738160 isoform X6 n=1 Tax=Rosa rugosa TaxID=74645 RepID=UPI002B41656E|nr:uncharacterized protein LOC133738160 isoform X6 [Rosa rugosa]XP_062021600.1 uncharacterized protein LOC133738160 isoform X6 [Rosa rugosa]